MTEKDLYSDEPELVVNTVAGDEGTHDGPQEEATTEGQAQARNMMQQGQC
ncbi:hypothetical protein [Streptomyces erythrochromogenes]|nr:hypothetical protein OG489_34055 [Streptomyces erythrochromogenes]